MNACTILNGHESMIACTTKDNIIAIWDLGIDGSNGTIHEIGNFEGKGIYLIFKNLLKCNWKFTNIKK